MNWFLSLFAPYVTLQVRCAAQAEQIRLLERQAELSDARTQDAKTVADAAWRAVCGRSIYGLASEAMPLPDGYVAPQAQSGRRMARELVDEQNEKAMADWMKIFKPEG